MNSLRSTYFFVLIFSGLLLCSCNQDPVVRGEEETSIKPENDFVWKALNSWYYWQKDVPYLRDDFKNSAEYEPFVSSRKTDALFHELLYHKLDRNSWIMKDGNTVRVASNGIASVNNTGFDFSLLRDATNRTFAFVNYVIPGTAAKNAGIKRGDVIIKVNGSLLNDSNIRQLNAAQVSVSVAENAKVDDSKPTKTIEYSGEKTYNLMATGYVRENPFYFRWVITDYPKNIGYIVYNSFDKNYNSLLNSTFKWFQKPGDKVAKVEELILDLRYNSGGAVETAVALAQMITGQFGNQPLVKLEYNEKHKGRDSLIMMTGKIPVMGGEETIHSLKLNRVFILTSGGTASASEIVIKCLKPYINVITIGSRTYGKYVGSFTLYDNPPSDYTKNNEMTNPSHNWSLQPIIFAYYDKLRSPTDLNKGMDPDYRISYFDYIGTLKDLDQNNPDVSILKLDPAIEKALEIISGRETFGRLLSETPANDLEFIASGKTMTPFGAEAYIELKE